MISFPGAGTERSRGESGAATYYRTCANARSAGVTPIRTGTQLYDVNRHLDRDKDGLACE